MITRTQMRAARALAGIDQYRLAELSGLSLPMIQRMEARDGLVRGHIDSLTRIMLALQSIGIEVIEENAASAAGGSGVRFKPAPKS